MLGQFYTEVWKSDGEMYKKNSLMSTCYGLQWKVKNFRDDIDIIKDVRFKRCNDTFTAQLVLVKKGGSVKVDRKPPISHIDLSLLYQSGVFATDSPTSFQWKEFFEILYYF